MHHSTPGNELAHSSSTPGTEPAHSITPTVLELGAGKGYLGASMVRCCGVQRLVVADITSNFRSKAS